MKISSMLILSIVTTFLFLTYPYRIAALTCYDTIDPLNRHKHVAIECGYTPPKPPSWIDKLSIWNPFSRKKSKRDVGANAFTVKLSCSADKALCGKVQDAFDVAGKILSETLKFNTQITVNATFFPFCKRMGQCANSGYLTLGGAAPARTIPVEDEDKMTRLYPQALVKQQGNTRVDFDRFDIVALFNADASFWFQGDGPIQRTQSDFLFVILHELIHGLGFTSSWDDYINNVKAEALTPDIVVNRDGQTTINFVEYAFDKYMVISSTGQRMSEITAQLNQFSNTSRVTSVQQFYDDFRKSSQYALATQMFKYATTRNALVFLPTGQSAISQGVILETGLVPYSQGSSVSHVDSIKYKTSSDFLMRYLQDRGVSLGDAIVTGGNYTGGSIGPKLKSVLESLGYATADNPNPYRPRPSGSGSPISPRQSQIHVLLVILATIFLSSNVWKL